MQIEKSPECEAAWLEFVQQSKLDSTVENIRQRFGANFALIVRQLVEASFGAGYTWEDEE